MDVFAINKKYVETGMLPGENENIAQARATYEADPSQANYAIYKQLVDKYNAQGQEARTEYVQQFRQAITDIPQEITQAGPNVAARYRIIMLNYFRGASQEETNTAIDNLYRRHNITAPVDWESIPVSERKYYPGAEEYFATLSNDEKIKMIGVDKYKEALANYQNPLYIDATFKRRVEQHAKRFGNRSDALTQAILNVLWEDLTQPEEEVREKHFEELPVGERYAQSFFQGARRALVGVWTFPVKATEWVIGKATGKPFEVPIFSPIIKKYEEFERSQDIAPPGVISATVMSALGTEEQKAKIQEQFKKYPIEMYLGGLGEYYGAKAGIRTTHAAKTAVTRAGLKIYTPLSKQFPSISKFAEKAVYYSPKEVLKRFWYSKIRRKPQVPPETWLGEAGPSGFVETTPSKTLAQLKRFPGEAPGTFKLGHATGARWRPGTIVPAKLGTGRIGEMFGTSFSPKGMVQEWFLRLKKTMPQYSTKMSILPKIWKRRAVEYGEYAVRPLPRAVRGTAAAASKFAAKRPDIGYIAQKMYVGGIEPEIKLFGGLSYKTIAGPTEWFVTKGRTIVVDKLKLGTTVNPFKTYVSNIPSTVSSAFSYSTAYAPPSLTSALVTSTLGSYKPSYKPLPIYSPTTSYTKPRKPSYTYKPYKPHYTYKPYYPSRPPRPSYMSYPSKPPYSPSLSYPTYPYYPTRPSKIKTYPYYKEDEKKKRTRGKRKRKTPPKYREREFKIKPVKLFKPKMVKP
jgi:hypothetical protein